MKDVLVGPTPPTVVVEIGGGRGAFENGPEGAFPEDGAFPENEVLADDDPLPEDGAPVGWAAPLTGMARPAEAPPPPPPPPPHPRTRAGSRRTNTFAHDETVFRKENPLPRKTKGGSLPTRSGLSTDFSPAPPGKVANRRRDKGLEPRVICGPLVAMSPGRASPTRSVGREDARVSGRRSPRRES
jgi:hypothetical protein